MTNYVPNLKLISQKKLGRFCLGTMKKCVFLSQMYNFCHYTASMGFYVTISNNAVIDDANNLDSLVFFMESAMT